MSAEDEVKPLTTTTTNYGWTKPDVGGSDDLWGGLLNADLDGIDSVVHGIQTSVPAASTAAPIMDGTAAVGTGTTWARADHVHPTDTSRASAAAVAALPVALNDNRIINGDMRIDQRNNGASGTANGYTVDRWVYGGTQTGKGTWGRNYGGPSLPPAFPYCLGFVASPGYVSLATDAFNFAQQIEADMVSDFAWGTASAQPVTLSFWAASSVSGTFSGSIANYAATRAYPFTFSLSAGWTKIVITVPGDTGGSWVMSGNNGGVQVRFDLGCGANYRGAAGAWMNGNIVGATGAVSVVATNAATFYVTGVKLEIGSVATPFNRQSLAKSMADCQRYYEVCSAIWIGDATASAPYTANVPYALEKRAAPTITSITQSGAANGNFNVRAAATAGVPTRVAAWSGTVVSTGPARGFSDSFSASAEL